MYKRFNGLIDMSTCRNFLWRIARTSTIRKRNRDDVATVLSFSSHVMSTVSNVRCFLALVMSLPSAAVAPETIHWHRYIVQLTSRHFKGYNFPPSVRSMSLR